MSNFGNFRADTPLAAAAMEEVKGVADTVGGWFDEFHEGISVARQVLGHDKTGLQMYEAFSENTGLFSDAGKALRLALRGVPELVEANNDYVLRAQQGVIERIHDEPGKGKAR